MLRHAVLAGVLSLVLPAIARAQPPGQLLHQFNGADGSDPEDALLRSASGTFYGTANFGGALGYGTAFELVPPAPGQTGWQRLVLHDFTGSNGTPHDGGYPSGNLVADPQGDLFGTAVDGGGYDTGVVFELIPPPAGKIRWSETVISVGTAYPVGGVIMDARGALYGVQTGAGTNYGFTFKLVPPPAGQTHWTQLKLHVFQGGADGLGPEGGVAADPAGNLYGVTFNGGAPNDGVVYELSPPKAGQTVWTETILHVFTGYPSDGAGARSRLAINAAGVLYGATEHGGSTDADGIVFSLTPPATAGGAWTYAVLFDFNGLDGDGTNGLLAGAGGTLLGTADGGKYRKGLIYQLTPPAGQATDTQTDLYDFTGGADGSFPESTLITDPAGNLYGSASTGGQGCPDLAGCGTVFELFH